MIDVLQEVKKIITNNIGGNFFITVIFFKNLMINDIPFKGKIKNDNGLINANLTIGRGQSIGIVAGSGVGKSVLLGMMSRFTEAEIVVVALIGERGREVGSFVSQVLNNETKKKTVIVAVVKPKTWLNVSNDKFLFFISVTYI